MVDAIDWGGWTPLSWAAGRGHNEVVKLLLETEKVDVSKQTLLYSVAGKGHDGVVKLLRDTEKRWGEY